MKQTSGAAPQTRSTRHAFKLDLLVYQADASKAAAPPAANCAPLVRGIQVSQATAAAAASTMSAASAMLPVSRVTGRMPAMWRGCISSNLQNEQISASAGDLCSSAVGPQKATY